MQWLADLIVGAVDWFLSLVIAIFELLSVIVIDMVCYVLDGVGSFIIWALNWLDVEQITNYTQTMWSNVPPELLTMAVAMGFTEAGKIIAAAVGFRIFLQLIPFTRLGS